MCPALANRTATVSYQGVRRDIRSCLWRDPPTNATICQGCQWVMDGPGSDPLLRVRNYVTLAGESLEIRHKERFRDLRAPGGPEADLRSLRKITGCRLERLPFGVNRISRAVDIILGNGSEREA